MILGDDDAIRIINEEYTLINANTTESRERLAAL
jgi:hypothetical protein